MPVSRAFRYISFRVPIKGAPGSSHRPAIEREREREMPFPVHSIFLSIVPSKQNPLQVPHWGPEGERTHF